MKKIYNVDTDLTKAFNDLCGELVKLWQQGVATYKDIWEGWSRSVDSKLPDNIPIRATCPVFYAEKDNYIEFYGEKFFVGEFCSVYKADLKNDRDERMNSVLNKSVQDIFEVYKKYVCEYTLHDFDDRKPCKSAKMAIQGIDFLDEIRELRNNIGHKDSEELVDSLDCEDIKFFVMVLLASSYRGTLHAAKATKKPFDPKLTEGVSPTRENWMQMAEIMEKLNPEFLG